MSDFDLVRPEANRERSRQRAGPGDAECRNGIFEKLMSMIVSGPLLSLRRVSLSLDGRAGSGVRGATLDLGAGEVGVVLGGRDAGKTTLLRLAGGMLDPDGGQVLFAGRDLGALRDGERVEVLAREVAWACRSGPGFSRVSMLDYISLPLASGARVRREEARERAQAALERLGVPECAELGWTEMSAWQRVCAELAQAIVRRPSLLLVDDLIDGLSRAGVMEAMRLIRAVAEEERLGALITADDIETGILADRLWRIDGGVLKTIDGGDAGAGERDWYPRRVS